MKIYRENILTWIATKENPPCTNRGVSLRYEKSTTERNILIMSLNNEVENVSIDYFTLTCNGRGQEKLWSTVREISKDLERTYVNKPWRFFGYAGYLYSGNSLGHFAYGDSGNAAMGSIVQASGIFSSRYITKFFTEFSRWTRIDLAVDVKMEVPALHLCDDYYKWVTTRSLTGHRKYSLVVNNLGGSTLYVGSRQSEEFGRVYDKGVEEGLGLQPGIKYRYEVELKGDKAKQGALQLMSFQSRGNGLSHPICVTVYDWFCRREVPPTFKRSNCEGLDLIVTSKAPMEESKLLWLKKQVSPTVREFLSTDRREVLDILGITDFYRVGRKRV